MEGRKDAPAVRDPTELPGGGRLGRFWRDCKCESRGGTVLAMCQE